MALEAVNPPSAQSSQPADQQLPQRDGTSQAARLQPALDPAYAPLDERSAEDLLIFAQQYAKELRFFNELGAEDGDWSGFLGDSLGDVAQMVRYLDDPERFQQDASGTYARSHLALLLTFLDLLQFTRTQLNDLTRRHLEFYYREALRLTAKPPVPDRIHVLVELAEGQNEFRLRAGSLLLAGQDSQGADLFYQTDQELIANRARVASLKSLFVQKQLIDIREAHTNPGLLTALFPATSASWRPLPRAEQAFMAMLALALGEPNPGGTLPLYPDTGASPKPPDTALLADLDALIAFIRSDLAMPLPVFRSLMERKRKLEDAADQQWQRVNTILAQAGKQRSDGFEWNNAAPRNFEANLRAAIAPDTFDTLFDTLPEVDDIYDLYRLRDRPEVRTFIEDNKLYMSLDDFVSMMSIIDDIYKDWRRIYHLLRAASRKKHPDQPLDPPKLHAYDPDKFNTLVRQTLGALTFPATGRQLDNLDRCYQELLKLEAYFHMSVEDFAAIREINARGADAQPWEWERVYTIMEQAYAAKALPQRWDALKQQHARSFEAMILFALGDPLPGNPLLRLHEAPAEDEQYIRQQLFLEIANFEYIKNVALKQEPATPEEWDNVYKILERAQRRKYGWSEPRPQIERWRNIYAADDAAQVQVRLGLKEDAVTPRWRTFGAPPAADGAGRPAPAAVGFAVASPLLALAEGARTITLTLAFSADHFDKRAIDAALAAAPPFRFFLSTRETLVEVPFVPAAGRKPANITVETLESGQDAPNMAALNVTIRLDAQAPPVAPLPANLGINTPWPILHMRLADLPRADLSGAVEKIYSVFQPLALHKVRLQVKVAGMTELILQNDDGVLNAKKPFTPFGFAPVAGSSFYIAHPELSAKRLDTLDIQIDWLGVAGNLHDYYQGYADYTAPKTPPTSPIADNAAFTAQLRLYDNRAFFDIQSIQLFHAADATNTNQISIDRQQIAAQHPAYQQDLQPVAADEASAWSRYWQVELLAPDFQHAIYPRAAASYANRKNAASTPDPFIVNPPYTPMIKRLAIGYSASTEIDLSRGDQTADRLYHLEPFGYRELAPDDDGSYYFLPQYVDEGELLIGLTGLTPPQNLALLFQMAEGSADPSIPCETVYWRYLSGNRWESLEQGRLLFDSTNGLLNTGIITFDLPPVTPSTRLLAGLYWLQATIAQHSRSVADVVAIEAQALSATFADQGNAPDHLSQPLPPERISGLADPQPEVRAIRQPYSSIGGKGPEQASRFYTRVSERLRHKNRALTSWDYERMILEAFPEIYKVKCLPVRSAADPRLAEQIRIIVIPDIRGKLPFDPFEPKAAADTLSRIERYLSRHTPPTARLMVSNPAYIRLEVRLGVRLRPGFNPGYYLQALNHELQRYLAPWAYDHSAEIVFGGKINANLIVNFVEERPYVDYVAGIKLFTRRDDGTAQQVEPHFAVAPDAILVSYREHQIDLISEEIYQETYFTGINYMKIELDFQIA